MDGLTTKAPSCAGGRARCLVRAEHPNLTQSQRSQLRIRAAPGAAGHRSMWSLPAQHPRDVSGLSNAAVQAQPWGSTRLGTKIAFPFYIVLVWIGKRAPLASGSAAAPTWQQGFGSWWCGYIPEPGAWWQFGMIPPGHFPAAGQAGTAPSAEGAVGCAVIFSGISNGFAVPYFKRKNRIQLRLGCRQPLAQYFLHLLSR